MSLIHYFPRYSHKENMVTNNSMLLFSRLYNNSTAKFKTFINSILEESNVELDTTVKFVQQVRGKGSVPDATIEQDSFKIIIETKLYGQENIDQIEKHWKSFGNEDKQIFLWINKETIEEEYYEKIVEALNKINEKKVIKISFASTTFKEICKCFKDILSEYDFEMIDLINDFEGFCNESKLFDNSKTKMRAVSSGKTFEHNLKNNIYYGTRDKSYQNCKYLGLYKNKAIRAIGEVICIVDAELDSKEKFIIKKVQFGTLSDEQKQIIKDVMIESKDQFGYITTQGHRFFFVEKYYEMEFIKSTKGGLMGSKYFDLEEVEGYTRDMSTEKIAQLLDHKNWNGSV